MRPRPSPRRRPTASGRTSRRPPRPRSPPRRAAPATRGPTSHARLISASLAVAAHAQDQRARLLVPVGALPDARLALEPAAVRLGDVVGAGREDVEDEAAAGREQPSARRASAARRSASVSMWSSERNGISDERRTCPSTGGSRRSPSPQVELARRRARRAPARPRASLPTGRRRSPRSPAAAVGIAIRPVPTPSSTHRPARAHRLVDVERRRPRRRSATTGRRGARSVS